MSGKPVISGECVNCKESHLLYNALIRYSDGSYKLLLLCYDCRYNKPVTSLREATNDIRRMFNGPTTNQNN